MKYIIKMYFHLFILKILMWLIETLKLYGVQYISMEISARGINDGVGINHLNVIDYESSGHDFLET